MFILQNECQLESPNFKQWLIILMYLNKQIDYLYSYIFNININILLYYRYGTIN